MIKITFPDGSVREYNEGVTGLQIAESISSRLAQDVLACGVNGEIYDLGRPIMQDAEVVLYKWEDEQGKHAFWHTSAHLLAEALQELYPGIQFGIGPAIENGFYYDVDPGETTIKEADPAGGGGAYRPCRGRSLPVRGERRGSGLSGRILTEIRNRLSGMREQQQRHRTHHRGAGTLFPVCGVGGCLQKDRTIAPQTSLPPSVCGGAAM